MADTHPEDLEDQQLGVVLDEIIRRALKVLNELNILYTSSDTSAYIAAAVYGVSIIMTLAILDQGSKHSLFKDGIGWNTRSKKLRTLLKKESLEDEAEEELFAGEVQHPKTSAEDGAELLMSSFIVKMALAMTAVLVGGALHIAAAVP